MLKFKCKHCNKHHTKSEKINLIVNGIAHYPESVNGVKPVFVFAGEYYCDEDCFINHTKNK